MTEINGKSVYNAIAMGKLFFYNHGGCTVKRRKITDSNSEIERFRSACADATCELDSLYDKACGEVGEANAQIFQIHKLMLEDTDYLGAIENTIATQLVNAEYAVSRTSDLFAKTFSEMDNEYMNARAADVHDISLRLIKILEGEHSRERTLTEPVIIVADDLTPSETVQLDKEKIVGFVTFKGSQTSHTAILARTMNIPALIGTGEIDLSHDGKTAILDGSSGILYINPDDDKIIDFKIRKKLDEEHNQLLLRLKGKPNETKSGKSVRVYANIGDPHDVPAVIANDAGGIGLFRSEFIYLEKDRFPTEDEQFLKYRDAAEKMGGKQVIVRTLDIGADKKIDYFELPEEENPALGFRAIRICLSREEIFKTQLRALLRASAYGNIAIMFPMIISVDEVRAAKKILDEVKKELLLGGIPFKENIEVGIMIETPAAAVISNLLAPEVDFFSIGTNDLTQYTLAIDRQNHSLDRFFDPHHPALLRLIETTVQNAHRHGIWAGICGELAADMALTEAFLKMGVDELSVSPSYILRLREKIRSLD